MVSVLRERPGPRPHTWLALGALVLLAHAALAIDWGALWTLAASPDKAGTSSTASPPSSAAGLSAASPKPPSAVVRMAQVRWIAPDATPAAPERPAAPPKVAQRTPPKPPPPAIKPATDSQPQPDARTAPESTPEPTVLAESAAPDTNSAAQSAPQPVPSHPPVAPEPATQPTDARAPAPDSPPTSHRHTEATPAKAGLQAAPTQPTLLPGNRWLRYDVLGQAKGLNYRASGEIRWQIGEGRYQADLKISAFLLGSRSQQSTGRLTDGGLVPERFADKSRSERAAHFEPEQGRIRFSNNAPDAPWLPGTQDRLSVFFQLAAWLNARPDGLREGERLSLPVAGTGGADQWQLLVRAQEPLDLPAGRWDTLRVEVLPQKTFDQRIELWLAPRLDHLPVRIRITQSNGDVVDQQLSALP